MTQSTPATAEAIEPVVLDLVSGHLRRMAGGRLPPRSSLRLLAYGHSPHEVDALKRRLFAESGQDRWYVVRTSACPDAVALRNGRPGPGEPRPPGVVAATPLVYVVVWTPDLKGHQAHERSLIDLRAVEVADVLRDPASLSVELERRNRDRCSQAVAAWPSKSRPAGERRLLELWTSLLETLREGRGGREGSVAFVSSLSHYAAFLVEATLSDDEWQRAGDDRPLALTRRWGEALTALDLFGIPALASVTGVRTTPGTTRRGDVRKVLERVLSENLDASIDHDELSSRLAGKQTIEQRLRELHEDRKLVSNPELEPKAREDLLRFCREREPAAFRSVEWLFYRTAEDRSSASLGLKGLLIERGTGRGPQRDPAEVALERTLAALPELPEAAHAAVAKHLAEQRAMIEKPGVAHRMATLLRALAAGQVPDLGDLPQAYDVVAAAAPVGLEKVAALWEKLAPDEVPTERAESLLLGLARALVAAEVEDPGQLDLWVEGQQPRRWRLVRRPDGALHLEALRAWLREQTPDLVPEAPSNTEDDEEQVRDDELEEVVFVLGGTSGVVARFAVPVSTRLMEATVTQHHDGLRRWLVKPDRWPAGRTSTAWSRLLATPSSDSYSGEPVAAPAPVLGAWRGLSADLGGRAADAIATLVGPLPPSSARGYVDAWAAQLARVGGAAAAGERERLMAQLVAATDAERFDEAAALSRRLKQLGAAPATAPITQEEVRLLLQLQVVLVAEDWDAAPERLVLTSWHPLVLRARLLAEDALARTIGAFLDVVAPPTAVRRSTLRTLERWGLPAPCHAYGWWDGPPRVFGEWSGDVAPFGSLERATESDLADLGVDRVLQHVAKYARLQPATRDGLQLRVHGDAGGNWAAELLQKVCSDPADDQHLVLEGRPESR